MWYYHITSQDHVASILEHGLLPKIPNIDSAPRIPIVYLSNSIGRLLDLREQQLEESNKSGDYALLKIWLNPDRYWILVDPDIDHDGYMVPSKIPPSQIEVLTM